MSTPQIPLELTLIDGGYHVKDLGNGCCIDILRMLFNYRVVLSEDYNGEPHGGIRHGFCYFGHGEDSAGQPRSMEQALLRAVLAATLWDGSGVPLDYDKQVC